jgi:hypothetical protein
MNRDELAMFCMCLMSVMLCPAKPGSQWWSGAARVSLGVRL